MKRQLVAIWILGGIGATATGVWLGRAQAAGKNTPVQAANASGIDDSIIDTSANPCDDFYQYACGGWLKKTKIPADKPAWTRGFSEVAERNEKLLHTTLETLRTGGGTSPQDRKLGLFYQTCMDEAKLETTAVPELKKEFAHIDNVKNIESLVKQVAHMHLGFANPFFGFGSQQDFKNSSEVIGSIDQGGLSLPDRDYYLKTDEKSQKLRDQYVEHVGKMFEIAGYKVADAMAAASSVMKIETTLAQASMSRVDRRDPQKVYHRINLAGLQKQASKIPWKQYLTDLGHPAITEINVSSPEYFAALNTLVTTMPIADLRTYLKWHAVHELAGVLSKPFVDENFRFFGKTLLGIAEIEPRWKRCVHATDGSLGELLAQSFIAQTFGKEGKVTTREMVLNVEVAMLKGITQLGWMDAATKLESLAKLGGINNKIGYPDKWRNYDKLELTDSFIQNHIRAGEFETHRQLAKIGKPVDRNEWGMTPPTVNAYYDPSMNEMVFPAGILQPPFFSRDAAPAVNYGAIGMVMGHELTHGFDDEGRQFDAVGNMRDWWSAPVGKDFDKRAECVVKQYDGYVAVDDVHINGKLTLGENIADLGGIKLAYRAFHRAYAAATSTPAPGAKFSDDQLLFLGFAQSWCSLRSPELSRQRAVTDPHSPPHERVDGPLSNTPEFRQAFQCKAGQKMVREPACTIW